jgi:hypothetical protein
VNDLDYDVLVRNEDPGQVVHADTSNGLRQIVSTLGGLKQCKTRYAVKTRSDLAFKRDHFLSYFKKYNTLPFDPAYKLLSERVVVLTSANPKRKMGYPFWLSDWFFFGRTEDLKNIFEIPLTSDNVIAPDSHGVVRKLDSLFSTEQYIWFKFISKYRKIPFTHMSDTSNNNIETSEKYIANNCILLSADRAGLDWIRFPGNTYAQKPALSNNGLYTFTEYKLLLNKYANNHLLVIPNPIEEITYFVVYRLRLILAKKSPRLWNFIRRLINRKTHKKLDVILKRNEELKK